MKKPNNTMTWHHAKDKQPKFIKVKKSVDTQSSKKVLVRCRFKNSAKNKVNKWRYKFGNFFRTKDRVIPDWWQVDGMLGTEIEVSHWAYITKPVLPHAAVGKIAAKYKVKKSRLKEI